MSFSSPIDVVYLWCDGSDPNFQCRKQQRMKEMGLPWNEANLGDIRYIDNNELKYSLRSVYKYLPWVNHIYIVTDNQCPSWFKENDKVSIVDHKDIIPSEYLPTFNSVTIESFIHRVPGLSEKFLLFNDDTFVNTPLSQSFFFENDQPIVRLIKDQSRWQFSSIGQAEEALRSDEVSSFRKTLINAWRIFSLRHGVSPFYVLAHTVDAYTKQQFAFVQNSYPELKLLNNRPFRTDHDIQRVIYQMEMVRTLGCPLREVKLPSFLQKHFPSLFRETLETFEGTESPKTWKRIRALSPKMFCLNAAIETNDQTKAESIRLLEELFPDKSPNELS